MQMVWNLLNERLLKWVKWEKGLNKLASARYQNTKYHLIYSHIGYWYINEQANVQYDLLT
jgi:RNA-directed DNA polymerase